ncbi:MAG: RluA family pseudouridine synthase [Candidatus Omnitrophota bacterium]|nr:RluA family pseudouridine synthase [Candidatus Omnitrophota bacterium]
MSREYRFTIGPAEAGMRLDRYLVRRLPEAVSRSMIQRVVREGSVTIGGRPVKAHYKLHRGEMIEARVEQLPSLPADVDMIAQPIPLEIVFEDAHVLVVNKPPGLVTHPAPGHWDGTLVNGILWHLKQRQATPRLRSGQASDKRQELPRAGIIHRLDKDTSGLLIVAKTPIAHAGLARQMKVRTIKRRYLTVVEGHIPMDEGTVNAAIGRHATHRKEMTIRHLGGRSAVTHYRVLKRFKGSSEFGVRNSELQSEIPHSALRTPHSLVATLLEVSLETGRTHQIRVHMAHLGYPVVGDTTYGKHPASFWQALSVSRQLLHAYAIRFTHPVTKQPIELKAPIPDDMKPWIP